MPHLRPLTSFSGRHLPILTVFSCLFFLATLCTSTLALSAQPFPDTGQTKCYDNTAEIPCDSIGPGDPFYGQDAHFQPRILHSYTKLGHGGVELPDSAVHYFEGDGQWMMTRDNTTGRTWALEPGILYTWEEMLDAVDLLNVTNFGGFNDWRAPSIKELTSILHYGTNGGLRDSAWFSSISYQLWSATSGAGNPVVAYLINISGVTATVAAHVKSAANGGSFAVRGEPPVQRALVNNGAGTATDPGTGLMWYRCSAGSTFSPSFPIQPACVTSFFSGDPREHTWQEALAFARNFNGAGYTDWRLPNINELLSLLDYARSNPAVPPLILGAENKYYWTSTTARDAARAFVVDLGDGYVMPHPAKTEKHFALLVRGGHRLLRTIIQAC